MLHKDALLAGKAQLKKSALCSLPASPMGPAQCKDKTLAQASVSSTPPCNLLIPPAFFFFLFKEERGQTALRLRTLPELYPVLTACLTLASLLMNIDTGLFFAVETQNFLLDFTAI